MKNHALTFLITGTVLIAATLGCGGMKSEPDWTKSKRIAGKDKGLSHVSGLVVDEKFAYVVIGGTVADQNEGHSGLRRVNLETGEVASIDDGKNIPQSENGGIAQDDKFIYWNAAGKIWRAAKSGGSPEAIINENVGIGIDMAVDNEKVYWLNHGYYSSGQPSVPEPVFVARKTGGKVEIFADNQNIPHSLVLDEKFVYWHTSTGLMKQPKSGGTPQAVYTPPDGAGLDELSQDAENLYFGFRAKGDSRWALMKVSKQGGEPTTLVKRFSLYPLAVDDKAVYFFDEGSLTNNSLCKVAKTGGEVAILDSGYTSGAIALGGANVYFASLDDIFSISK